MFVPAQWGGGGGGHKHFGWASVLAGKKKAGHQNETTYLFSMSTRPDSLEMCHFFSLASLSSRLRKILSKAYKI